MTLLKKLFFITLVFLAIGNPFTNAQAIHFTYFQFAPQSVNPGFIGAFEGSYRGFAIFRDQYQNTGVNGFRTLEISVDAPIIRGFREKDWIGIGISMNVDSRGVLGLRDTYSRIGAAYHFSLDKKQKNILTLGVQTLSISRRLGFTGGENLTRNSLAMGGAMDPDLNQLYVAGSQPGGNPNNMDARTNFGDWTTGLTYTNKGKENYFVIGFAASSFLRNNAAFRSFEDLPLRLAGTAQWVAKISKRMTLEPAFFTQFVRSASEVTGNIMTGYQINPEKSTVVKVGLGARTGTTSGQFLAGFEYEGWRAGFSYDLPLTGYANAPGIQNSFEVAVGYYGIIKKTPKVKPIVLCPRL
jgi:type IX secretion system PorP/SprF family membrane protein